MKNELNVVYADVNSLLEDICQFLKEELKNGKLSKKASKAASLLIERSKVQIQEIAKVVPPDSESGRYVDMGNQNAQQDNLPEYIDPDCMNDTEVEATKIQTDLNSCPYMALPASGLPSDDKSNSIERREKFLFFEHQKKLFVGLCENWFLVYSNQKDMKPIESYNLQNYEARKVDAKEFSFEMVSKLDDKRQLYTAINSKDLNQWIAAINRKSRLSSAENSTGFTPGTNSTLLSTTTKNALDTKSIKEQEIDKPTEHPEIYEELKEEPRTRRPMPELPELPPRYPNDEELADYDFVRDVVQEDYDVLATNRKSEELDEIYDVIRPPNQEQLDETEEIYDLIQSRPAGETKPVPPVKPHIPPKNFKKK